MNKANLILFFQVFLSIQAKENTGNRDNLDKLSFIETVAHYNKHQLHKDCYKATGA